MFNENFKPNYIYGEKKDLKKLGIKVTNGLLKKPWNWTYENPIIEIPKKEFKVEINWNDNNGDCDIIFKNGVVFGHLCSYTDLSYINRIE